VRGYEMRQWCTGNIEASQALAPGSTPGWRILFFGFVGRSRTPASKTNTNKSNKRVVTLGIEPKTNGLLDQRSTN
jgi:hypothetical protein